MSYQLDLGALVTAGQQSLNQKAKEAEALKVGILRGGSSGALFGGKPIGSCPRQALLRYAGINYEGEEEEGAEKERMFEAGHSNETSWSSIYLEGLSQLGLDGKVVLLAEEEIPIAFQLPTGEMVTGRPDHVFCSLEQGSSGRTKPCPILGIEHKLVCSLWTAKEVLGGDTPQVKHLTQAALYSWELGRQAGLSTGLPYEVVYTNRSNYAIGRNHQSFFPAKGEIGSQSIAYKEETIKGRVYLVPNRVNTFTARFALSWTPDGQLVVDSFQSGARVLTPITQKGIVAYYQSVADSITQDRLPERIKSIKADGSTSSKNVCVYCPLAKECGKMKAGSSTKAFIETAIRIANPKL